MNGHQHGHERLLLFAATLFVTLVSLGLLAHLLLRLTHPLTRLFG